MGSIIDICFHGHQTSHTDAYYEDQEMEFDIEVVLDEVLVKLSYL